MKRKRGLRRPLDLSDFEPPGQSLADDLIGDDAEPPGGWRAFDEHGNRVPSKPLPEPKPSKPEPSESSDEGRFGSDGSDITIR